jgi:hypothetical protein
MHVGIPVGDLDVATREYLLAALSAHPIARPTTTAITTATDTVVQKLILITENATAISGQRALAGTVLQLMASIVAQLGTLRANPPPDGATLTARLDAYLGSATWRSGSASASATTDITASGTWTKPSTGTFALIECWGGGGAGASVNGANPLSVAGGLALSQPGGAGGSYRRRIIRLADLPTAVTVTVGLGGQPSYTASADTGRNGGTSSFGGYVQAPGGTGAQAPNQAGSGTPGASYAAIGGYAYGWVPTAGANPVSRTVVEGVGGTAPSGSQYYVPGTPPQAGVWSGGGGGIGYTLGATADDGRMRNGASSVKGGGGGGAGIANAANPGATQTLTLIYPGRAAQRYTVSYTNPTTFPSGTGGASGIAGSGGNGGAGLPGGRGAWPGHRRRWRRPK